MIINLSRRWVLFTPAKTGSASVRKYCIQRDDCVEKCIYPHGLRKLDRIEFIHDAPQLNWMKNYKLYGVVRDPRSRLVSCWSHWMYHIVREPLTTTSFHTFLDAIKQGQVKEWLAQPLSKIYDNVVLNDVIRLETIDKDLSTLFQESVTVERKHVSDHPPWQDMPINLGRWWWEPDLKFGYI
jgi:hypothetical protein